MLGTYQDPQQLFMRTVGHGPVWKLPERLMFCNAFFQLYQEMYEQNGCVLKDLDLDPGMELKSVCVVVWAL
eukprot:4256121-Lingulodinium_polyedra.AAC.1